MTKDKNKEVDLKKEYKLISKVGSHVKVYLINTPMGKRVQYGSYIEEFLQDKETKE